MPRSAGSILSEQHTVLRNGKAERIFAAALYEGFLHVISIASPEGGSAGGEGICVLCSTCRAGTCPARLKVRATSARSAQRPGIQRGRA
jgi:hypothetical protein